MKIEDIKKTKKPKISKSKYELTLSEFPLFLLSKSGHKDIESIDYKDTIVGKDRAEVKREWKVYPDGKLGFGTASTFSTLFELFQIWKEKDFDSRSIQFGSVYNLLKRKGKYTGSREYKEIIRDLNCLVGIRIEAKNAFWDYDLKAYVDMTFHLFDTLYLYKNKPYGQATLPFAKIEASDILYGSIQKNSLLTAGFDSKFFHSLAPVERRLALYLSKIFRSQFIHKRELLEFAQQIPIHVKQAKLIKQRLKKTCTGLMSKGFDLLQSFDFEKGADGKTEFVVFNRGGTLPIPFNKGQPKIKSGEKKDQYEIDVLVEDILDVCQDEKSIGFYKKVAQLLPKGDIYKAISEVKEIRDLGEVKKSKGAIFTSLIKKYATQQGIDL